jgi:uncharacterized protein (TIGR03067 family)
MRAIGGLVLGFTLLPGLAVLGQEPARDKEKIRGTWRIVSFEPVPKDPKVLKDARVIITADRLTIRMGETEDQVSYTLDPSKKPKHIDLVLPRDKAGKRLPGIYQLDGDDLKLYWNADGEARPEAFPKEANKSFRFRYLVLKRESKR